MFSLWVLSNTQEQIKHLGVQFKVLHVFLVFMKVSFKDFLTDLSEISS